MKIEIRGDVITIDGYVNAVDRYSKPLLDTRGNLFVEKIEPGAFANALKVNPNVSVLFNHREDRLLGSVELGNLELFEDNIGLRAICKITDNEVVEKAKKKELSGWSFGFIPTKDSWEQKENEMQKRTVSELELFEVSILDVSPAYIATSIEVRTNKQIEHRTLEGVEIKLDIDYGSYENDLKKVRGL